MSVMNNSAEKIGNNLDILTEILLRLPTKSLLKFKCVSKQLLSLISNPQFCLYHTRQHQHNDFLEPTALLLAVEDLTSPEFDMVPLKHEGGPFVDSVAFNFIDNATQINLLQSCNGLFLCECFDSDNDDSVSRYFLCNPTTKQFKLLSIPNNPPKDWDVYVSLAYDPLKSPHYKVISIRETSEDSSQFEIRTYSSESRSWAESKLSFEVEEKNIDFKNVVFCNGMIHWNSYSNESLRFDVDEECLLEMPMPMPTTRTDVLEIKRYFGECRGTLYLAVVYHHYFCLDLDVYEMARDYSHWFHKHHLNLADAMNVFPELNLGCHPFCRGFSGVCFLRSETENEPRIVVWADGKIICYDFNDGAWKRVYDAGHGVKIGSDYLKDDIYHAERFLAYNYFENLSCI